MLNKRIEKTKVDGEKGRQRDSKRRRATDFSEAGLHWNSTKAQEKEGDGVMKKMEEGRKVRNRPGNTERCPCHGPAILSKNVLVLYLSLCCH